MRSAAPGPRRTNRAPAHLTRLWAALALLSAIVWAAHFAATAEGPHAGTVAGPLPFDGVSAVAARVAVQRIGPETAPGCVAPRGAARIPAGAELHRFDDEDDDAADLAPRSPKPVQALRARGLQRGEGRLSADCDALPPALALSHHTLTSPPGSTDGARIAAMLAHTPEDSGVRDANRARGPPSPPATQL